MLEIRELNKKDLPRILEISKKVLGPGYFTIAELEEAFVRSHFGTTMCSLVLEEKGKVIGARITFPHGQWTQGKGEGLSPQLWPHPLDKTAYFQSIFLDPGYRGQGLGYELSNQSLKILQQIGARGVVCHSWLESPNDASNRYLQNLNFEPVATYFGYWKDVDYLCTGCETKPCQCTAEEMYLDFYVNSEDT